MSEPTNADVLNAISELGGDLKDGQRTIIDGQQQIIRILVQMQTSEHQRSLGLSQRVEHIEQLLGIQSAIS